MAEERIEQMFETPGARPASKPDDADLPPYLLQIAALVNSTPYGRIELVIKAGRVVRIERHEAILPHE